MNLEYPEICLVQKHSYLNLSCFQHTHITSQTTYINVRIIILVTVSTVVAQFSCGGGELWSSSRPVACCKPQ
jgi:hypothetical protein